MFRQVFIALFLVNAAHVALAGSLPFDYAIVPHKRIGPLTPSTDLKSLQRDVGAGSVNEAEIDIGEGEVVLGEIIYPGEPTRSAHILWRQAENKRGVSSVTISGDKSVWRLPEGISLGTDLKTIEKLNGKTFELTGFGWDYEGTIVDWKGGRLTYYSGGKKGRVLIRLGADHPPDSIVGDKGFSSSHPDMQKANPRVREIVVEFR